MNLLLKIYGFLLKLYPSKFRIEFQQQMLLDFSDLLLDARSQGRLPFLLFFLHEIIDFPANLVRMYWRESRMFKLIRSQPVSFGLRNAVAFGLAFGLAGIIARSIDLILVVPEKSLFGVLSVTYYDLFHTEHGLDFISWLPSAFGSLLTGFILGAIVALLFAERPKRSRYLWGSMICWFLFQEVFRISFYATNLPFYLGTRHYIFFSYVSYVLGGMFLGLVYYITKSENRLSFRMLCMGLFVYPLAAYFYIKLLISLMIIESPWMFAAMMVLWMIFIGSVIFIAAISIPGNKVPWLVILSGVIFPLLPWLGHWLVNLVALLFGKVQYAERISINSSQMWTLEFRLSLDQAVYGILFGLIIGVAYGLLNKRSEQALSV